MGYFRCFMISFIDYLLENYGACSSELSKTDDGNELVDDKSKMISLDAMAEVLYSSHSIFNEKFATADSLYVVQKDDTFELYFIEYKMIDFNDEEDRLRSVFGLKKCISKMSNCEHNCEVLVDIKKYRKELVDKSHLKMRSKPYDSLTVLYYFMNSFFSSKPSNFSIEQLFNFKKFYILVSKTQGQYNPILPNKSNRNNKITKPLRFMQRLKPYHYDEIAVVSDIGFKNLMVFLNR